VLDMEDASSLVLRPKYSNPGSGLSSQQQQQQEGTAGAGAGSAALPPHLQGESVLASQQAPAALSMNMVAPQQQQQPPLQQYSSQEPRGGSTDSAFSQHHSNNRMLAQAPGVRPWTEVSGRGNMQDDKQSNTTQAPLFDTGRGGRSRANGMRGRGRRESWGTHAAAMQSPSGHPGHNVDTRPGADSAVRDRGVLGAVPSRGRGGDRGRGSSRHVSRF
jgi:hypothetical protein